MTRCRWVIWAAGLLCAADAAAVVPRAPSTTARMPAGVMLPDGQLVALPAAGVKKPVRARRDVERGAKQTPAWRAFAARGGTWQVWWDRATGVPNRIFGSGIETVGASANPALAEGYARAYLEAHLELLAPGAQIEDFVLVSNHDDGDQRSVGFVQVVEGRRVVGGQVSFRFKRDRLFVIASEALPDVRATISTAAQPHEVILPLLGEDSVLGYRVAVPVTWGGGADGRYEGYEDPATGELLAARQTNLYATGRLLYRGVERYPGRGRVDRPASRTRITVNGQAATTAPDGSVEVGGGASVGATVNGDLVTVTNQEAPNTLASATLTLPAGGEAIFDASATPQTDAQLITFTSTNVTKDYIRTHLDPASVFLEQQIVANVNIEGTCNAFFDGAINFLRSSEACENTGLLADVVYHELGHGLHIAELIPGVAEFDSGLSEGASDFLAASITGDPEMGRGFRLTDAGLRHLDPRDDEAIWPSNAGEAHQTGLIFGGTFWDLRTSLITSLGETEGIALVNRLYIAALRRSSSIPGSLVEALAADDDDGNLDNGTPHECLIRAAFARHGMRTATGVIIAPEPMGDTAAAGTTVRVDMANLSPRCPEIDRVDRVTLFWKPSPRAGQPRSGSVEMTRLDETRFWAPMPLPVQSFLQYQAKVKFADASLLVLPDNRADPFYEVYQGTLVPLYCTDFETDPFQDGWTQSEGVDRSRFEWGVPEGGFEEPAVAWSGMHVLGQALGRSYEPDTTSWVEMPAIDPGAWSDVRLHYRRHLSVEDSHFDQARITVNGAEVWLNATADAGDSSSLQHIDKEWVFQDVLLTGPDHGQPMRVRFELETDAGLEYGGWAIDDVCIVANATSVCGDGVRSPTETCDLGAENADEPDKCRTWCQTPMCGDFIVDANEQCDAGSEGSERCDTSCATILLPEEAGCCSSSRVEGAGGLALLVGLVLRGRGRRRRRAPAP